MKPVDELPFAHLLLEMLAVVVLAAPAAEAEIAAEGEELLAKQPEFAVTPMAPHDACLLGVRYGAEAWASSQ